MIAQLLVLADEQQALENEVLTLEESLKAKQAVLRELSENRIKEAREALLDAQQQLQENLQHHQERLADMNAELDRFELENGTAPEGVLDDLLRQVEEDEGLRERVTEQQGLVEEWRKIISARDAQQALVHELTKKIVPMTDDTVTLPDGRVMRFKQDIYVDIPKKDADKRAICFSHLREVGAENMCAHRFTIDFPKGLETEAQRFAAQLQRIFPEREVEVTGIPDCAALKSAVRTLFEAFPQAKHYNEWSVNAQTLKAWVGKRLKAGHAIPDEFGVYAPVRVSIE